MTWNELGRSKYVLLTSFKANGIGVGVPIWVAQDGDRLVMWTGADSWKVKRIRRNPAVTLQICDRRGRNRTGEVVNAHAEIQDAAGTERTRAAIAATYGIIGSLAVEGSKLVRGVDATVGLTLSEEQ